MRLASWIVAMVTTMKVPPTQIAETTSALRLMAIAGAATPTAMTTSPAAAIDRGVAERKSVVTPTVETVAATPNRGQAHPNTIGSWTSERAAVGMKVAGMMYPKPKAP
jgi:hypothetical protein